VLPKAEDYTNTIHQFVEDHAVSMEICMILQM